MITYNGISGVDGRYLFEPQPVEAVATALKSEPRRKTPAALRAIWRRLTQPHLGLGPGIDPARIAHSGWAIVFHRDEDPAVKAALGPLVAHRQRQIGNDRLVKIFEYCGETRDRWLADRGVAAGAIVPDRIPYYLLLIGGPERIPYSFCHELDVEYAVGALHFESATDYAQYVDSVIDYENGPTVARAKEVAFFGPRHPMDAATSASADYLVTPLALGLEATNSGFRRRAIVGPAATKAALTGLFRSPDGTSAPAILFSATHGMGWPKGHPAQVDQQGALLCQDWPGLGRIAPTDFFSSADVPVDAHLQGLIAFLFACFGAGTPEFDQYAHVTGQPPPPIASKPFVAALPKRLLSHPNGGALACIGHVERAWGYSMARPAEGTQLQLFQFTLGRLMYGEPVGHAIKDFNERFASLSVTLSNTLETISFGKVVPDEELAATWTERNDAGGYLVIGDPAVKLRVADLA